jgi:hypothetical protein
MKRNAVYVVIFLALVAVALILMSVLSGALGEKTVSSADLDSILIVPGEVIVRTGTAQQYVAIAAYADSSTADVTGEVFWTSSDEHIAAVDSVGLARGKANGTVTITASMDGMLGEATLTVSDTAPSPDGPAATPLNHYATGCSKCHSEGIADAPLFPAGHENFADENCQGCHLVDAGSIPEVPPGHFGTGCSGCHAEGTGGASQWPAGHDDFSEEDCASCHRVPTGPASSPPDIPSTHPGSGCSVCHADGTGGATQWPAGHDGFSEESCQACHAAGEGFGTEAPYIPAEHYSAACSACHSSGLGDAPQWPSSHDSMSEDVVCSGCHQFHEMDTPAVADDIPSWHNTIGDCTACHTSGWPTFHEELQGDACEACHLPSTEPPNYDLLSIPSWHETEGQCTACHTSGLSPSHNDLSSDACSSCHVPSDKISASPVEIPSWHSDEDTSWYDDPDCAGCHSTPLAHSLRIRRMTGGHSGRILMRVFRTVPAKHATSLHPCPPTSPRCRELGMGTHAPLDAMASVGRPTTRMLQVRTAPCVTPLRQRDIPRSWRPPPATGAEVAGSATRVAMQVPNGQRTIMGCSTSTTCASDATRWLRHDRVPLGWPTPGAFQHGQFEYAISVVSGR